MRFLVYFLSSLVVYLPLSIHAEEKEEAGKKIRFDLQFVVNAQYTGIYGNLFTDASWSGSGSIVEKLEGPNQEWNASLPRIHVLTNDHVVNAGTELRLNLFRDEKVDHSSSVNTIEIQPEDISILYMDFHRDLALVSVTREALETKYKINFDSITAKPLCTQDEFDTYMQKKNPPILVVGDPGAIAQTTQKGFVASNKVYPPITGYLFDKPHIHVNAPINEGNSGGALLTEDGEDKQCILGVPSAGITGRDGMGYVIPLDQVRAFLDEAKAHQYGKEVTHGYLYYYTSFFTNREGHVLGTPDDFSDGEMILWFTEEYHDKFPLKELDVITAITAPDGKKYLIGKNADHMQFVLYSYSAFSKFIFHIIRDRQPLDIEVISDKLPPYSVQPEKSYLPVEPLKAIFENLPKHFGVMREYYEDAVILTATLADSKLPKPEVYDGKYVVKELIIEPKEGEKQSYPIKSIDDLKPIEWDKVRAVAFRLYDLSSKETRFVAFDL